MPENLNINLNINPQGAPNETSAEPLETTNTSTSLVDRNLSIRNAAQIGVVANAGKQVFNTFIGQVGSITGDQGLQRSINNIGTAAGILGAFAISPFIGAINLAVQSGIGIFKENLERRNAEISATYYSRIRGSRSDKGRIV